MRVGAIEAIVPSLWDSNFELPQRCRSTARRPA
jgi:hypothetical protein